jgi:histidinol-phosphate/aromatic aminotransferase/cobyric acid decarboxylase-like protein
MPVIRDVEYGFQGKRFSRRQMARMFGMFAAGAAAVPVFSEAALARISEQEITGGQPLPSDVVRIDANENPLGPCKEGLEAIARISPYGGRYSPFDDEVTLRQTVADIEGVDPKYISLFAGSSDPLFRLTCAFTSPTRSWVMADPGYGGGAPAHIGSKVVRVPLKADYSHDVAGMLKADPQAGAYYICNPNNPSGTTTPVKDIEYLVANKPKGSIVIVDEAYIHFRENMESARALVLAEKDVVILRTFSKVYGMAGIRSGFAMARPDLLETIGPWADGTLPITGVACATASLKARHVVAERRAINTRIRGDVFEFLEKRKVKYIPSVTNFFMLDAGRPWVEFAKAMAQQKVMVGRLWPVWPTMVRVSVGTQDDMNRFKDAFDRVMA